MVCDTAENINESVRESAACVIVSANIERGHVVPDVQVTVILLALVEGLILVNAGTSDNQELVLEHADCVPVASEFQVVPGNAVEDLLTVVDDFVALVERRRILGDVSSSDEKQAIRLSLDVLEVVLELVWNVHTSLDQRLLGHIVSVNHL